MKRYSLIISLVLILSLSGVASAQVLLPADAGGPATLSYKAFGRTYGPYPGSATYPLVGHSSFSYYVGYPVFTTVTLIANAQGAFEFNLSPVISPTFTSKDFTARLGGLTGADFVGAGTFNVDLFDMGDGTEDGNVSFNDFNSARCNSIASSPHVLGGAPAVFNDIDVTCAVRNDLFGTGQTDFSGFILTSPDATGIQGTRFNTNPTLTINPGNPGPDCPGCGGGGSDGGGCFIANAAR